MNSSLRALIEERFGPVALVVDSMDDNAVLRSVLSHKSHRDFTADPIPAALLQTLFACAFSAPSKSDLQQACVIQVEDRDKRHAIESLIPSMPWIACAPVLLVFCGDNRRIRRICELRGKPFGNDHLDSFFNAGVDAALVMMNFIRGAEAAGLGCCPLSVIRNHAERVSELLEVPEYVYPVAGLVVGHPAKERMIAPRLSLRASVHRDRYDDSGLEEDLEEYDRRRHERLPIAPQKQRLVDEFGQSAFYGWSEDKARQVAHPERDDFGHFARRQGFSLE